MRENLTHTIEDYLKTIYEINYESVRAGTNQIAERLGITPASVTGMLKKLAQTDPPLIDYQKHHGVSLTNEGEKVALEILRHHRLLEMFLHQMLGYNWDEVHDEADRLEHVISEELEERIAQVLGNPLHDPHGDPIPLRDFSIPESGQCLLSELRTGQKGIVCRVRGANNQMLRYLREIGLVPQTTFKVTKYSPFDENISLQLTENFETIVLGPRITSLILIDLVDEQVNKADS